MPRRWSSGKDGKGGGWEGYSEKWGGFDWKSLPCKQFGCLVRSFFCGNAVCFQSVQLQGVDMFRAANVMLVATCQNSKRLRHFQAFQFAGVMECEDDIGPK